MSNRVDQELTRIMQAVSASARPAPLLMSKHRDRRRLSRPVVALASGFVVVMLTVGLGALVVSSIRPSDSTQEPATGTDYSNDSTDAYWEWMSAGAKQLEPTDTSLEPDVVGVVRAGPVPKFDPSELGEVQRIRSYGEFPYTSDGYFDDRFPTGDSEFIPPVAFIGTLEGTSTQVLLYRALYVPTGEVSLCLDEQNMGSRGVSCMTPLDLANDGFPWTVSHENPPTSEPTIRVTMAMLPRQTAVVVVTTADGRTFVQRPAGGVALIEFVGSDDLLPMSVEALDQNGDLLAQDSFDGDTPSKGAFED